MLIAWDAGYHAARIVPRAVMPDKREPLVTYDVDGHVAVFTLTNPPANTYSHEMMEGR